MRRSQCKGTSAFTFTEVMVSAGCGLLIVAALVAASVALQRSFVAVEGYSVATGDQLRVQDYIAMDCRRAVSAAVDTGSWVSNSANWSWVSDAAGVQTLILSLPNYYDNTKNSTAPYFDPTTGKILYGDGNTTTISYYKSGASFIRQIGSNPNDASKTKAVATNVATFKVTPMGQATVDGTVSCSITFSPSFTNLPGPGPIAGTTIFSQTFLRNARARK